MAFPESVTEEAWERAGGKCECTLISCAHIGRCNKPLTANNWHAHHKLSIAAGGSDSLNNCQALCIPCHENTGSFGG